MANKHLQLNPHRIMKNKKVVEHKWWYEDIEGMFIYLGGKEGFTIKWSSIRAALKRKDK